MEVRRLETQYPIPRREVYRYLGLRKQTPDPPLQELIEECITELYRVAVPKYLYKIFPIQIDAEHNRLDFGFMQVPSVNLTKNLRDCEKAAVMAATLGADVDRLMHRYEVTTAAKSVILQAAAAALVEQLGGEVVRIVCVMELAGLEGRKNLEGYDIKSLIVYPGK